MSQPELDFQTARPARAVFCHQEFLDKLAARRNDPIGKRTSLLLQRMAIDIARLHYKGTSGVNKGWRRSRLGGSSGSHFYAWWTATGGMPIKTDASFDDAPAEAVFLRDIRHHDDHAPLNPGNLGDDYLPLTVPDLRQAEYAPEPWTPLQTKFARAHGVVRILKGHPGSGKTTALLHAADSSQAERVLYLTFSSDLAALARDYFDRYCSRTRTFTVLTYQAFLQQLLDPLGTRPSEIEITPAEGRAKFRRDALNYQRLLGPWSSDLDSLYDEIHAHIVGAALPETSGRFPKAERVRLPDVTYESQRTRYLGAPATKAVLETVRRLDKIGDAPLADRYFPELAIAWRAAHKLMAKQQPSAFSDYTCIAVDEVQDLTPLEAFVVMKLARRINDTRSASLMLAGDEAQTVRATDFEWAWLNDMLHSTLATPQEFKMSVNLRSPRRIAALVNRSWDFYDFLDKQDRPSGTGYAEIEDDSPDQILYAATPAAELPALLRELQDRPGLALIAFDKSNLPKETLPFVLSPAEAKGLDFHSVCVLNGGPLLQRVVNQRTTNALVRRLAIDQLRVVLSRPTERLLWVDTAPDSDTVTEVSNLLRSSTDVPLPPISVEALRTSLNEEELDIEERIQRCQRDARQLVSVKPDLAWSRAHQAVALLGVRGDLGAITDQAARAAAHLTLAEVCFLLAFRGIKLSPELGKPNLYAQCYDAAQAASKIALAHALRAVGVTQTPASSSEDQLNRIASAIQAITHAKDQIPGWFLIEVTPRAQQWLDDLDRNLEVGDNPLIAQRILPPFFDVLNLPDAQARKDRLAQRAVKSLMKQKKHLQALQFLEELPNSKRELIAECYEELGLFARAAATYLEVGDSEKALKCYRSAPDFESALKLVRALETHPAKPSLEWLADLGKVLERRPENFNRVMTFPEKKLLESMLEKGLGVQRKKPAAKKAATKKRATPVKRPPPPF